MEAYYPSGTAVANAAPDARVTFIRQTYGHLAGAILAFVLIEAALFQTSLPEAMMGLLATSRYSWFIVLGAFMGVSYLANNWAQSGTSLNVQYAGLGLYVVAEAVIFVPLLFMAANYSGPDVIPTAGLLTLLLFTALTYIAFTTKKDFSFLGGILTVACFVSLGVIAASAIFGFTLGLIFSALMVLVAAGSILYNTSNVMFRYNTSQYVAASLSLFASVALLFWYILRIVMGGSAGRSRICLLHWNRSEAEERAAQLVREGFHPDLLLPEGLSFLKALKNDPPKAIVISLDRLPMQGRDVALAIRLNKETRKIPLLFGGGAAAKVARVKASLPDAGYAEWSEIGEALRRCIASPPAHPVVPPSVLAAYADSTLAKKLTLHPDSVIALIDAPDGFAELLLSYAPAVQLEDRPNPKCNLLFWFVRSAFELDRNIDQMAGLVRTGSLWILWPKRTSGGDPGLSPERLRTAAMALGLVDYKICSVDKTWSGLLFTRRKDPRLR